MAHDRRKTTVTRESNVFQSLPESFFPEQWQNDAKMGNYLAEFRPYALNPENYTAKMRFWKDLIKSYCQHKGNCEFTLQELKVRMRSAMTLKAIFIMSMLDQPSKFA